MLDKFTAPTTYINPPGVDDLIARWQSNREERARDRLTALYWKKLEGIGRHWAKRWEIDSDDAIQEVALGFLRAVDLYDRHLCSFSTYLNTWAKSRVARFREVDHVIHVPVHLQDRGRRVGKAKARLRRTLGRPPTVAEVAANVGISEALINRALEAMPLLDGGVVSASTPVGEDGESELGDLIPSDEETRPDVGVLGRREVGQARAAILQAAELLPAAWRIVLMLRLIDGRTLVETGERLGVTRERVRQIETRVLGRMREALRFDPRALNLIGLEVDAPVRVTRADSEGLGISDITAMTGLDAAHIDYAVRNGTFPRPFGYTVHRRARLWDPAAVNEWIVHRDAASGPTAAEEASPRTSSPEKPEA